MLDIVQMLEARGTDDRRDIIMNLLKERGFEFSTQVLKSEHGHGANIIVEVGDGNEDSRTLVVCANYDVVPGSGGANDNASSIAVLIGLLQDFWDEGANNKIKFVFLDGSESGLEGAKHFVKENKDDIMAVVNLKMIGRGKNFALWPFYSSEEFEMLFALEGQIKKRELPALRFPKLLENIDHEPFRKARIEAFTIALLEEEDIGPAMEYLQAWEDNKDTPVEAYLSGSAIFRCRHSATDTADMVDVSSMQLVKDIMRDAIIEIDTLRL